MSDAVFFRKAIEIGSISDGLLKGIKPVLQEGIVFDFSQQELFNDTYTIPIYLVEDQVKKLDSNHYKKESKIAEIVYQSLSKQWLVNQEEWDFSPNLKEV